MFLEKVMLIKIYKSKKLIQFVDDGGQVVSQFPIGIGENETGHKLLRSDLKTPEGSYKVCVKNNKSKFHLSLGINYPNPSDAALALSDNRISHEEYESILLAHKTHGGSDWSTPIGGEVYIHGGLEDKPYSEGCIRMYNKDIESIFESINIGDEVIIYS